MADLPLEAGIEGFIASAPGVAANIGSKTYLFLLIFLSVFILGGLVFLVLWWNSFRTTVKIKELISSDGHYLVCFDKAKRKLKNGAEFWKFRGRKCLVPAPPKDALQVTNKGRYFAECMHEEKSGTDAGYRWIIPSKTPESGAYSIGSSQEERALLSDRVRRAEERKSRSLLDVIMQFAGMAFVLMIVVALLAFYGEISKSQQAVASEMAAATRQQAEVTKQQAAFTEQLNKLFLNINCQAAANADLPLDQQIVAGGQ
jgi:hypothetical protein